MRSSLGGFYDIGCLWPARAAIKIGAMFDGERVVVHLAFDVGSRQECDPKAMNFAVDPAMHGHIFANHVAGDPCAAADDDGFGLNIADNRAFDMDLALRHDIADDRHIGRQVRCRGVDCAAGTEPDRATWDS